MENKNSQINFLKIFITIWRWTIMIFLWYSIYLFRKSYLYDKIEESFWDSINIHRIIRGRSIFDYPYTKYLILMIIVYCAYLKTASASSSQEYLTNIQIVESIHEYMKNIFLTPPQITWDIKCYHYETRVRQKTNIDGSIKNEQYTEKVISCTAYDSLKYCSWRDISDLFILDSHKIFQSDKKILLKLHLKYEIEYADQGTKISYQNQKDDFYNRFKHRDTYIEISESRYIPRLNEFNMIMISDAWSILVNRWIYIIFVYIIPFLAIYESYLDYICVDQEFKIKKVISDKHDLNKSQNFEKFQQVVPNMPIFNQLNIVFEDRLGMNNQNYNIHNFHLINQTNNLSSEFTHTQNGQLINQSQDHQPTNDFPDKDSVLSNHTIVRSNRKETLSNNVSRIASKKSLYSLKSKNY